MNNVVKKNLLLLSLLSAPAIIKSTLLEVRGI